MKAAARSRIARSLIRMQTGRRQPLRGICVFAQEVQMKILRLLGATFIVMGACSTSRGGGSPAAAPAMLGAATDTSVTKPPVVQVRAFSRSSVVSVVAWDANNAEIGL